MKHDPTTLCAVFDREETEAKCAATTRDNARNVERYEARIVDPRLEATHYMRAFVEGWGEVRFVLSPEKRSEFRIAGRRYPLDKSVRDVGTSLIGGLMALS